MIIFKGILSPLRHEVENRTLYMQAGIPGNPNIFTPKKKGFLSVKLTCINKNAMLKK